MTLSSYARDRELVLNRIDRYTRLVDTIAGGRLRLEAMNEQIRERHAEFGSDTRLDDPELFDSYISVCCTDTSSAELVGGCTFFFLRREHMERTWLWELSGHELVRVSLAEHVPSRCASAFTVGYTKASGEFRYKNAVSFLFVRLLSDLLRRLSSFRFIECTGSIRLPERMRSTARIDMTGFDGMEQVVGVTYPDGKTVERFCVHAGMRQTNLYSLRSVGKVYALPRDWSDA